MKYKNKKAKIKIAKPNCSENSYFVMISFNTNNKNNSNVDDWASYTVIVFNDINKTYICIFILANIG